MLLIIIRDEDAHLDMISILHWGILPRKISKYNFNVKNGFNQILLSPNAPSTHYIFLMIITKIMVWFDLGWKLNWIHRLDFFRDLFRVPGNYHEIIHMCAKIFV